MSKEKTTKEKLLEEFENKYSSFELCNQISKPELDKLKNFLSQAIDQTREETIKEVDEGLPLEYHSDGGYEKGFNSCLSVIKQSLKSLINK